MDIYNDILKPAGRLGKKVAVKGGNLALKGAKAGAKAIYKEATIQAGRYDPVALEYQTPATAPLGYTPKGARAFRRTYNDKAGLAEQKFENDVKEIAARAGANHVIVEGYDAVEDEASFLRNILNKGLNDQFQSFTAGEFKNAKIGSGKSTKISANLYLYKRP